MRNIYLKTTDEKEAIKIFHENLKEFFERKETEIVEVSKLLGRISAKSVFSKISSPAFHSCAMDGVMIESKITKQARENKPLYIKNTDFEFCNTGQYLKKPYDSVIMIEDIKVEEDGIVILNPVRPWENVRIQGEDVIEKDLIYTAYHEFSAVDLSVLKSCGVTEVEVLKKPIIGIIPTGDEIVDSNKAQLGKILESNSQMLKAMSEEIGASAKIYDIAKDDESILKQSVLKAIDECDFIVVIAGSSAGSKDYTLKVLKELGEVYVHGISIKPGKPAILGKIKDKPFVGLPGFPVASHIVFDNFVITTILKKLKKSRPQKQIIKGFLTKQVISSLKNTEYIRVKIGLIDDRISVTPLDRKAGSLYSLAESDGYLVVEKNSEGYERNDKVEVILHRPISMEKLQKRIIAIGSHDIVLDVINDNLKRYFNDSSLVSSHVGSFSGVKSLKNGDCHVAPSHLLDKNGTYNKEIIDMFFKKDEVCQINVVGRRQGILVPKGNPKNIKNLKDLLDKKMVNRQRGAGTRVLFDYLMKKEGLEVYQIDGYDNEVTTHLSAALAVKNGDCDFSIGVQSAAIKMDIDFIYLKDEEYRFILKREDLKKKAINDIIEILKSNEFKDTMREIGGYNTEFSGKIIEN